MSETCHPGIAYILQLYTEEQSRVDTALTHSVCHMSKEDGMRGMELPYQLRSDWMVTCVLFLCFILVSYVLAHGKKHLEQQFKNFALSKERASLFDDTTASDVRYTLVLILQTCILSGFCVFLYSFVNWIFFNKTRNIIWLESYFNVVIGAGFLLFPIVLLIVYFDLSPQIAPYFIGFVIIIAKILLFYKCFSNFFNKFYGAFHLILYFCALEILPDFVLWKGIILANNILILNF